MFLSPKRLAASLAAAAALCATAPLAAQVTTGSFRGRVTNNEGEPVVNAQVMARNASTGIERSTLTDGSGRYLLPLVPPGGPYTISVQSIGFASGERPNLQVSAGDVQTVDFQLAVQAVQLQGIEASAAAQVVDVARVSRHMPPGERDHARTTLSPAISSRTASTSAIRSGYGRNAL